MNQGFTLVLTGRIYYDYLLSRERGGSQATKTLFPPTNQQHLARDSSKIRNTPDTIKPSPPRALPHCHCSKEIPLLHNTLLSTSMCRDPIFRLSRSSNRDINILPDEILCRILSSYCDCEALRSFWQALSVDKGNAHRFWNVFSGVLRERLRNVSQLTTGNQTASSHLETCLLESQHEMDSLSRNRLVAQCLTVLDYEERLGGVIWCGYMEFKDPLLPDWSAETIKVILRYEENQSNRSDLVGWNTCFSHTIKLCSQLYNFVPVRPRGQIFAVNDTDRQTLKDISSQLESRDQVMTLRFPNRHGFILRIVSPRQAQHRLARFRGSPQANFQLSPDSLVCSWESNLEHPATTEQQLESISRILLNYDKELPDLTL